MKLLLQISIIILLCGCGQNRESDVKFDVEKWKTDERSRYRMVNDLIQNKLLIDKSKAEVIDLLGEPEENSQSDCFGYPTYEPDEGFTLDHPVLQVNFDEQNKVQEVFKNHW